jgi:hypothetical protein
MNKRVEKILNYKKANYDSMLAILTTKTPAQLLNLQC